MTKLIKTSRQGSPASSLICAALAVLTVGTKWKSRASKQSKTV